MTARRYLAVRTLQGVLIPGVELTRTEALAALDIGVASGAYHAHTTDRIRVMRVDEYARLRAEDRAAARDLRWGR